VILHLDSSYLLSYGKTILPFWILPFYHFAILHLDKYRVIKNSKYLADVLELKKIVYLGKVYKEVRVPK
jgi:hypothetical protein